MPLEPTVKRLRVAMSCLLLDTEQIHNPIMDTNKLTHSMKSLIRKLVKGGGFNIPVGSRTAQGVRAHLVARLDQLSKEQAAILSEMGEAQEAIRAIDLQLTAQAAPRSASNENGSRPRRKRGEVDRLVMEVYKKQPPDAGLSAKEVTMMAATPWTSTYRFLKESGKFVRDGDKWKLK